MTEVVRVGVVVDDPRPRWQSELIDAIAAAPELELAILMLAGSRPAVPREPWMLRAYRRVDERLHRGRMAAFAPGGPDPPGVPVVRQTPDASQPLAPRGASTRPESHLDVVLDLTGSASDPDLTGRARSTWALAWGEDRHGAAPAGLAEMIACVPTTVVRLVGVEQAGPRREIGRTTIATHPYSLVKGRALAVAATRAMVLRNLRRLCDRSAANAGPSFESTSDAASGADRTVASVPARGTERPADALGNQRLVAPLLRFSGALGRRLVERLLWDEFHWAIAIAPRTQDGPPDGVLRQASFRMLVPPRDRFYADPFVFEHGGEEFLFLELCRYRTGRGVIAVSRIGPDGGAESPRTVLERPHHLSYPFVFEHGGEIFMIPETFGTGTVELYRCRRFPEDWALDTILLRDVIAADATVLEHDGRWWMFACIAPPGMSPDTELHLFHADDVRGPWQPHRLNPVVSDVRAARPAGRIWHDGRSLVRPAQDCSVRYGHGLAFRRITTLTVDAYAEEAVATVGPEGLAWCPRARGIHTWNTGPRWCATDVCTSRFRGERWLSWGGAR